MKGQPSEELDVKVPQSKGASPRLAHHREGLAEQRLQASSTAGEFSQFLTTQLQVLIRKSEK